MMSIGSGEDVFDGSGSGEDVFSVIGLEELSDVSSSSSITMASAARPRREGEGDKTT